MRNIFFILFLAIFIFTGYSQEIRIGEWRSHLNYTEGIMSEEVGSRIFCATRHGLFYVEKNDLSIVKLSKTDGFSETEISAMRYDKSNDILLIAYKSSLIDMLKGGKIYVIPDIFRSAIMGKKAINNIYFYNKKAYISCSFGIVVFDIEKMEVKETYSEIGYGGNQVEVFSVTINNNFIYASTKDGILKASLSSPNLLDYNSWSWARTIATYRMVSFNNKVYAYSSGKIVAYDGTTWSDYIGTASDTFNSLEVYHDKLIISFHSKIYVIDKSGNIFNRSKNIDAHVILDENGIYWWSVPIYGLIRDEASNVQFMAPNCPGSYQSWAMGFFNDKLYVVPGAVTDNWAKTYKLGAFFSLEQQLWTNKDNFNEPLLSNLKDLICLAQNPIDKHIFIGSFGMGILEVVDGHGYKLYNQTNSALQPNSASTDSSNVQISSIAFDSKGNMWVSNWQAENAVCERLKNGSWKSYDIGSSLERNIGKMIVDDFDQKWMLLPVDGGIIVFDETKLPGVSSKKLTTGEKKGNLPSAIVKSIAKDLDGKIWIGTDAGVAVFYDPSLIFTNYNYDAQQVWVDAGDNSGYLLATETVLAITVDGANNKWLGTKKGVWYVSSDGTKILKNFNTQNSPLPSDYIRDIAIDPKSGEVFFATNGGIVSYRGNATGGDETFGKVYAFPNPVRPGYEGVIAIRGLVRDADVRITDIAGNLVFETKAEGGQAVWDGKNFDQVVVKSGVYMVFSTNEDGSEKNVTKIMIIR